MITTYQTGEDVDAWFAGEWVPARFVRHTWDWPTNRVGHSVCLEDSASATTVDLIRKVWTMERLRDLHRGRDVDWFGSDNTRFFQSRYGRTVYGGRFFTTSERPPGGERKYTVREIADNGDVETLGEFYSHNTRAAAVRAIAKECKARNIAL